MLIRVNRENTGRKTLIARLSAEDDKTSFITFYLRGATARISAGRHVDISSTTMPSLCLSFPTFLPLFLSRNLVPKSLLGELGQHKGSLVDLLAVVLEKLVLLLGGPAANGLLDVDGAVLAAHHEADLAGRVGGDGGPAVLGDGEDLLALLLEVGDHAHVEPGVLGCEVTLC